MGLVHLFGKTPESHLPALPSASCGRGGRQPPADQEAGVTRRRICQHGMGAQPSGLQNCEEEV